MTIKQHFCQILSGIPSNKTKTSQSTPKYSSLYLIACLPEAKKNWSVFSFYYIMIELHIILSMASNLWFQLERTLNFKWSNMFDKPDSNHWLLLQSLCLFLLLLSVRGRTATLIWQCRWRGEKWIEVRFSPKWNGNLSGNRWHLDVCFY